MVGSKFVEAVVPLVVNNRVQGGANKFDQGNLSSDTSEGYD